MNICREVASGSDRVLASRLGGVAAVEGIMEGKRGAWSKEKIKRKFLPLLKMR